MKIDKTKEIAYKIYRDKMVSENEPSYKLKWYFLTRPEKYKEYFEQAKLQLRNEKIKKILNG